VSRSAWSAFAGTGLDEKLRALRVTQVVIVGIATSFGVESTARAAHDLGYHVTIPVDTVTDMSIESHEKSATRVFPALAETGTVDGVLSALAAATA
jgi:nicotinamidase-related amidase